MLLHRLKSETAIFHQQLENDLDLLRSGYTRQEYADLLKGFYGFYAPWEALAAPFLSAEFFEPRRKAPLLLRDLETLSQMPLSFRIHKPVLPDLRNLVEVLGSMYVLEGSTLGGQYLSRHFHQELNISKDSGGAFFHSYGSNTGTMWRQFGNFLELEVAPNAAETLVKSACTTFQSLHNWFREEKLA